MHLFKNKFVKFGIVIFLYLAWVIWVGNFWLLLGLPIIYDMYISKKVNWTFWKKRGQKNSVWVEWLDALIFAVVAVTLINIFIFQNYKIPTGSMEKSLLIGDHLYVSKLRYGPKIPNTPLSFPFAQHTLPGTTATKSYLEWVQWPYKRLAGFRKIKNDDIVVFNFPEGDTVVIQNQAQSYYSIVRSFADQMKIQDQYNSLALKTDQDYYQMARKHVWNQFDITVRPVDRRDNYIKRCVAIAGDTLEIRDGQVIVNGKPQKNIENIQYRYRIATDGNRINPKAIERLAIAKDDLSMISNTDYISPLTPTNVEKIKQFSNVLAVEKIIKPKGEYSEYIFPHDTSYLWNEDNFGPLWIPAKGVTIDLNTRNLCFYERIIDCYEENDLKVDGNKIWINGVETNSYTFKMDYYFMMGDNRHDSADSRFWGFVPEDHVVGAPVFVWLSLNKDKKFLAKIRLNRFFINANK
jgi:signal peptidase I